MGMTALSHHHNRVQGPSQIRRPGQKDSHRFQPRCHCPSLQVRLTSGRTGWGSATGWPPAPSTTSWWTRPATWGSTCGGPMSSELSSGAWLWGKYKCHPKLKVPHKSWFVRFTDLSTWFLLGVVWTSTLWVRVSRRSSPPPRSLRPTETGCLGGFLGGSLRMSGKILWPFQEHNFSIKMTFVLRKYLCWFWWIDHLPLMMTTMWPIVGSSCKCCYFQILFLSF